MLNVVDIKNAIPEENCIDTTLLKDIYRYKARIKLQRDHAALTEFNENILPRLNNEFLYEILDAALDADYPSPDLERISLFLKCGVDPNIKTGDDNGIPVLAAAAKEGWIDVVEALIKAGANVNETHHNDHTALLNASSEGHLEIVKILLKAGADVEARVGAREQTALIEAADWGHTDIVKVLLDAGANVNSESKYGFTALILASGRGDLATMKILLDAGADIKAKTSKGLSILDFTFNSGQVEALELLETYIHNKTFPASKYIAEEKLLRGPKSLAKKLEGIFARRQIAKVKCNRIVLSQTNNNEEKEIAKNVFAKTIPARKKILKRIYEKDPILYRAFMTIYTNPINKFTREGR